MRDDYGLPSRAPCNITYRTRVPHVECAQECREINRPELPDLLDPAIHHGPLQIKVIFFHVSLHFVFLNVAPQSRATHYRGDITSCSPQILQKEQHDNSRARSQNVKLGQAWCAENPPDEHHKPQIGLRSRTIGLVPSVTGCSSTPEREKRENQQQKQGKGRCPPLAERKKQLIFYSFSWSRVYGISSFRPFPIVFFSFLWTTLLAIYLSQHPLVPRNDLSLRISPLEISALATNNKTLKRYSPRPG